MLINQLSHPALQGLFRKYTTVHGSIGASSTLYRSVDRVHKIHLAAISKEITGKRVWISTDEWTDAQGHAIVNQSSKCLSVCLTQLFILCFFFLILHIHPMSNSGSSAVAPKCGIDGPAPVLPMDLASRVLLSRTLLFRALR